VAKHSRGFGEDAPVFARRNPQQQHDLREVQASVAKTHFSQLLDEVERGTTIVVLRHGRPVARIVPDREGRQQRIRKAIENIRKLGEQVRKETGGATVEEIISSIHEGHKY
jgi:prevent-host-death family protein